MRVSKKYEEEAEKLVKAIDISVEAFQNFPPSNRTESQLHLIYMGSKRNRELALNPEPRYRKLASLKYLIEAVLTPFQEGAGEHVEYFWKRVAKENLGYQRENKLEKILARGKIKGRIEYDYVIDSLVVAQQSNIINEQQAAELSDMLAAFEKQKRYTT
jgi:hypothetical protein